MTEVNPENPLDMPLGDIKIEPRQLVKPGIIAEFKIVKAECKPNDSRTLMLEFEPIYELEGKEPGTKVAPERGHLYDTINTIPTGMAKEELLVQNCGQFAHAFDPTCTRRIMQESPANLQGKIGKIRVGFEAEGTKKDGVWRGARNNVAEYIPRKKTQ